MSAATPGQNASESSARDATELGYATKYCMNSPPRLLGGPNSHLHSSPIAKVPKQRTLSVFVTGVGDSSPPQGKTPEGLASVSLAYPMRLTNSSKQFSECDLLRSEFVVRTTQNASEGSQRRCPILSCAAEAVKRALQVREEPRESLERAIALTMRSASAKGWGC